MDACLGMAGYPKGARQSYEDCYELTRSYYRIPVTILKHLMPWVEAMFEYSKTAEIAKERPNVYAVCDVLFNAAACLAQGAIEMGPIG